jgi:hypothetical protein
MARLKQPFRVIGNTLSHRLQNRSTDESCRSAAGRRLCLSEMHDYFRATIAKYLKDCGQFPSSDVGGLYERYLELLKVQGTQDGAAGWIFHAEAS